MGETDTVGRRLLLKSVALLNKRPGEEALTEYETIEDSKFNF